MDDDADLLKEYAETGSQDAFARLVGRYVDLVYSAARRQVEDPGLAEDVTQAVFLILAERAGGLPRGRPLSGWLLRVVGYAASNARRARGRRTMHERRAAEMRSAVAGGEAEWEEWAPMLDEGIARLRRGEREALVLRYFERKDVVAVAGELGISPAAAEKRITRAVAKLRDYFARRGALMSGAGLVSGISARGVEVAPVKVRQGMALGNGTRAGLIAQGAKMAMKLSQAKAIAATLAGVVVTAGVGIGVVRWAGEVRGASSPVHVVAATTPWPVKFSGGSVAEVVGVSDYPEARQWWAADGTPIAAPAQVPPHAWAVPVPIANRRVYRVLVRHEAPRLAGTYLGVALRQPHDNDSNTGEPLGENGRLLSYVVAVPAEMEKGDIMLSLARDVWDVDERYDLQPVVGTTSAKEPALKVVLIGEEAGHLTVRVVRRDSGVALAGGEEQVHVARLDGGEDVSWDGVAFDADGRGATYRFPIAKEQAAALVHRWRPFEIAEVANVSLKSGVGTQVRVARQGD